MAGRIYSNETEFQERVRRDNETLKALSSIFRNAGLTLGGGGVVQVYSNGWEKDPNVVWWFLISFVLIFIGVALLRFLQAES